MREATIADLPHFARAAEAFIPSTPFVLDLESYLENVVRLIESPDVGIFVNDRGGHCAVMLQPSLYSSGQLLARVISTWGTGGLECFKACERWARERGAEVLMADCLTDERIASFYAKIGMQSMDSVYVKGLTHGN